MAATQLKTRILNKISTWTEWEGVKSTFKPLRGEICIVEIPSGTTSTGLTPPATGIKVGDGTHFFGELPWIQAVAGDVTKWCKDNMVDFESFKVQVQAAVATSEGALQDAIDALSLRVTNLEATVNTSDNSNAKLRQAITDVNSTVAGHTEQLASLTSNKADKAQVATDIAAAKTAVLGTTDTGADYEGTVKGAYEAAAVAKNAADAAASAASTNLQTAKDYTNQETSKVLGTAADDATANTVYGAKAAAAAAQGTANTNAGEITAIKEDIEEINNMLGGTDGTSVNERLTALETNDSVQDGKIKDNSDAIAAEKERAEGVEADHEGRIATMENFWKAADDPVGTIDKLSEIVDYISRDEQGALDMAADIEANTKAIEAEVQRAEKAESDLQDAIDGLRGDALETDTLGTVKAAAAAAEKKADDNLAAAKIYAEGQAAAVLGTDADTAGTATVHGALKSAAAADGKAVAAQSAAEAAQGAADDAQDAADQANTDIAKILASEVAEGNGKISTLKYDATSKELVATRKEIVMADMSATEVFIFNCGSATEVV